MALPDAMHPVRLASCRDEWLFSADIAAAPKHVFVWSIEEHCTVVTADDKHLSGTVGFGEFISFGCEQLASMS